MQPRPTSRSDRSLLTPCLAAACLGFSSLWAEPGLTGLLYDSPRLTRPYTLARATGLEAAAINWADKGDWSLLLTGQLTSPATGLVRFRAEADDGLRFSLDGALILDGWGPGLAREGACALTAGQPVDLRLDYYQDGGPSALRLLWLLPGETTWQPIPASALSHLPAQIAAAQATLDAAYPLILRVANPDPARLPSLWVWKAQDELRVAASFPSLPGFTCDSWCYESALDFLSAHDLGAGRLELTHRFRDHPAFLLLTAIEPTPDSLTFTARVEPSPGASAPWPDDFLLPNLCWQLKRAESFRSEPDPYPQFAARCFIYTSRGREFLLDLNRRPIPCRAPRDPVNQPPWVQMYVAQDQPVPSVGLDSWADYSLDRYTVPVVGAVSRDGRHLAALAAEDAVSLCQAWHDCLHINARWLPATAPWPDRRWILRVFLLPNDPDALLARARADTRESHP